MLLFQKQQRVDDAYVYHRRRSVSRSRRRAPTVAVDIVAVSAQLAIDVVGVCVTVIVNVLVGVYVIDATERIP